jgi:hypothetical protein
MSALPQKRTLQSQFDNSTENFWKFKEVLVADPVKVEPVSTSEFPANREINRETRAIRALGAILNADTKAIS